MPHFQDTTGKLHFLSEDDVANGGLALLPAGCKQIDDPEAVPDTAGTFTQSRAAKIEEINAAAGRALAVLTASYPAGEVSSWGQQMAEAEALALDPSVPAPLLLAIAEARGIALADLAARVRAKRDAYAVASGKIIGQRQALEDAAMAIDMYAPDAFDKLAAIGWQKAEAES